MDDRVLAAAENHARWCDLVCRSHAIPTVREPDHWVALRRPPGALTDAVTLLPGASADDVLRSAQDGSGCSVTDSFAELDLAGIGFDEHSESRWIFRFPLLPTVAVAAIWSVVETEQELDEWAGAADASDTFRPELLDDASVRFLIVRGRDGVQAGAIATRSAAVVGLSNVFTTRMSPHKAWSSLATAVAGQFPAVPLVGCERGEGRKAALAHGFVEVGAVRVWRRPDAGGP